MDRSISSRVRSAFTLVELLIVMAMLAALAGLVMVRLTGGQAAARDSRRQSDIRQYQNALEVYANANNGLYPVRAAVVVPTALCGAGNPLGSVPCTNDPTTGANYQYMTDGGGTRFVLWATLEKPNPAQVYYVCSNGKTGTAAAAGFSVATGTCP